MFSKFCLFYSINFSICMHSKIWFFFTICGWIIWDSYINLFTGTRPDSRQEFPDAYGFLSGGSFYKWWRNWVGTASFAMFAVWSSWKAKCKVLGHISHVSSEGNRGIIDGYIYHSKSLFFCLLFRVFHPHRYPRIKCLDLLVMCY